MDFTICQLCNLKSSAAQKLSEAELGMLGENCAETHYQSGDIIIKQDAHSTNVAYLKSGLVKIHTEGTIKDKIIKITKAPAYLCLPNNFGDKINHFSATALESTTVCFINVDMFKKLIYENGDFAYQIILDMSKSELQNFHNCLNNAQKQNIGRVADVILFFADSIYSAETFKLPVTREELAALAGITRESVSRILTELNNDKTLDVKGRQITILNRKILKQISEKA